jgi:hypothetical protein
LSTRSHNNKLLAIEERRRRVASLLTKCKTQTEIARHIGVDQSTISDDVKALREMSQRFIYDLAKSDLGFYYKSCLDGLEEVKKEAWDVHDRYVDPGSPDIQKVRLQALKVIIQAEVEKFKLLTEGPNVVAVNKMSERISEIERAFQNSDR